MCTTRPICIAIFGVYLGTAPHAKAGAVLDQQYFATTSGEHAAFTYGSGFRRAETFTVGVAGTLSEIDIFLSSTTTFTGFNILSTSAGAPTATVLTTGTLLSSLLTEAAFSVSLAVTVREVLAIEPITLGEQDNWRGIESNTYAGGGDFFLNTQFGVNNFKSSGIGDDFQTFVSIPAAIPEPASLLLFGAALAGVAASRRERGRALPSG